MDNVLIPVGVAYAQVIEDFRAVVRHELNSYAPAATGGAPPADELLTVREAAELLDVTVQSIHEWKRRGMLPYQKMGSRTYFVKGKLLAAMSAHQRTTKTGKGASSRG